MGFSSIVAIQKGLLSVQRVSQGLVLAINASIQVPDSFAWALTRVKPLQDSVAAINTQRIKVEEAIVKAANEMLQEVQQIDEDVKDQSACYSWLASGLTMPAILKPYYRLACEWFDSIGDVARQSPFKLIVVILEVTAMVDGFAMPIVGEGEQHENDRYVEQLQMNATAAVEELRRRGISDHRIAVGGHSYGAFMTANLLARCPDLFLAGIARNGAYNRTLTPFGFQSEERNFWEAAETYAALSPFFHADKIRAPLLLIHSEADPNPGTFPMQSERMFAALKGLGGAARLVLLPKEGHFYRARESILHCLAEQDAWLEKHVRSAPPPEVARYPSGQPHPTSKL